MRATSKIITSTALLFWMLFPISSFTNPHQSTREGANIRADSTTFSESIGSLSEGEIVEVTKQKHDWFKIILPEKVSCWIAADYLKKIDKGLGEIIATNLNIRSQNSLEAAIIGSLQSGDKVVVKKERGDWAEISCYPYARGWVHQNLLRELSEKESKAYFTKKSLAQLTQASKEEKKNIREKLLKKGEDIIPVIESEFPRLSQVAIYEVIEILTRLTQKNPGLTKYFFKKITFSGRVEWVDFLPKSAAYLDVLGNTILKDSPKIPFYYLAQAGKLSRPAMRKSYNYLKEKHKKQKIPE